MKAKFKIYACQRKHYTYYECKIKKLRIQNKKIMDAKFKKPRMQNEENYKCIIKKTIH